MSSNNSSLIGNLLIPRYNELSLFLMSIAFVLLFSTQPVLRSETYEMLFEDFDLGSYIVPVILVVGILCSVYHIFTNRPKAEWEKGAMLSFAVLVNGVAGIAAGMHLLENSHGLLVLFPMWNVFNGILLLVLFRFDVVNESNITDENATLSQVFFGLVTTVATFAICTFVYKMYWAVTYSICLAYASNVNGIFEGFFALPQNKS